VTELFKIIKGIYDSVGLCVPHFDFMEVSEDLFNAVVSCAMQRAAIPDARNNCRLSNMLQIFMGQNFKSVAANDSICWNHVT